ncbi:MAG: efflux RND transporter periplasmic adaptor subunit [Mangrovibacterium sp.]
MKRVIKKIKKRTKIIIAAFGIILVVIVIMIIAKGGGATGKSQVIGLGDLEALVSGRGEINGEKSTKIELDPVLQDYELRVWGFKIIDLIQEGKKVNKGDFIAQLDQSELMNNMRQRMIEKEKFDADLKNAVIDSTVNLTAKREDIANALLDLQYKQIDLDLSKYESGAQQRKAQMEYQKAQIAFDKKKRDYVLEQNRLKVRIRRFEENGKRLQDIIDKFQKAIASTRISSPGDGIVMIDKDFLGKKLTKDSRISSWMPTIAMLPDMSSVIVQTYIKEIDITKVNLGDSVRIKVDALPNKILIGKVHKIANMGEAKSGFDMNVFEVIILLDHSDPDLKPGMTCNNDIIISKYKQVLLVPLRSIFKEDKTSFVYVQNGRKIIKKAVELGDEDARFVVVLKGLNRGDRVLLYEPKKL